MPPPTQAETGVTWRLEFAFFPPCAWTTVMDATIKHGQISNRAEWPRMLHPVVSVFRIRDERGSDVAAREALLDTCFGPGRFAKTCERLREGRRAADGLSFVAMSGGRLVGTVQLWDIEIGNRTSLMLGPLAVDPALRSAGIGRALIEHSLLRARKLRHNSVILVGDAPYYAKFGFDAALTEHFVLPGPVDSARFLGLELIPGALKGAKGRIVGAGAFLGVLRDQGDSRLAA